MNKLKSITEFTKNKKLLIFSAAIIGILLIAASYFSEQNNKEAVSESSTYAIQLENNLTKVIEKITGKNTVEVMITIESIYEIQAQNENVKTSISHIASHNTASSEFTEKPMPKIAGAVISVSNIKNESDFKIIEEAAATALGINKNKIYIIGGKSLQ